jgi:hypothetical protein
LPTDQHLYDELAFYSLSHGAHAFIHQHVVDAFTAQHADQNTKPIAVVFALAGLYLHLEKGLTGRQVQQMHMRMANRRKQWPRLPIPTGSRGSITAADVLSKAAGPDRDSMIHQWCASVWQSWADCRPEIVELLRQVLDTQPEPAKRA